MLLPIIQHICFADCIEIERIDIEKYVRDTVQKTDANKDDVIEEMAELSGKTADDIRKMMAKKKAMNIRITNDRMEARMKKVQESKNRHRPARMSGTSSTQ